MRIEWRYRASVLYAEKRFQQDAVFYRCPYNSLVGQVYFSLEESLAASTDQVPVEQLNWNHTLGQPVELEQKILGLTRWPVSNRQLYHP